MNQQKKPALRVAARVLRQLGAELITSDEIALNELVKNAFDARSPRVKIEVFAPANPSKLRRLREQLADKQVTVEVALNSVFTAFPSTLSTRKRAELIAPFREAASSRTSLASHIETFLRDAFRLRISDTGGGMGEDELLNAFLVIGTPHKWIAKQGAPSSSPTVLGEKGIGRLSMMRLGRFATVRSGKAKAKWWKVVDFDWQDFDDPKLFIEDIEIDVQPDAPKPTDESGTSIEVSGLHADWNEHKLEVFINGYVRRLQDPLSVANRPYPVDVVFNGTRLSIPGFPKWLRDRARCSGEFLFDPAPSVGTPALKSTIQWQGSVSGDVRNWSPQDLANKLEMSRDDLLSLGPLRIGFMWFNRAMFHSDPDTSIKNIRDELNIWCGGFAIYRDGFRVGQTGGMEDDWLEMDKVSLKSSGYTVNRYQTVGSVSITSRENPALVDAANREGLVDCPQYQMLKKLFVRVIIAELKGEIATVQALERKAATDDSVEQSIKQSHADVKRAVVTLNRVMKALPEAQKKELVDVRVSLEKHEQTIDILEEALKQSRETQIEVLELAGIGMVVEIVVHELARLTESAEFLLAKLTKGSEDKETLSIAQALREQFKVTNKRIRTVDALSPSGRNRKSEFDVVELIHSVIAGYAGRLKRHQITYEVKVDGRSVKAGINVHMVKGLVAQVMENLVNNSVYWLQKVQAAPDGKRHILVEVDSATKEIHYSDTGPGIDPEHRTRVFRPYFSLKPKGKGLGLFIANEIVSYHGGKFYLDESTGSDSRLHTFILQMPG